MHEYELAGSHYEMGRQYASLLKMNDPASWSATEKQLQFTRACAVDWASNDITVNAILPGGFFTEPNQRWAKIHPEVITTFKAQIPMGDFGKPDRPC